MENMPFGGFSAGLRHQNHPATVGGILITSGLATIFTRLEFAGLLYLMRLAGEIPGFDLHKSSCPVSVHHHRIGPASSGIYLQNMLLIPLPP